MNVEFFISLYPTTSNERLAEVFGISETAVASRATRLGLKKSREYIGELRRKQTLGHQVSDVTRAKISAKAKGRKVSDETKAKILRTKQERDTLAKGEKHYKWKGGKPWERFKNPQYIKWRNAVLERDGYVCQHCSRRCKKYERGLAAHHIKDYANHPELRFEVSNGITLCRNCHLTLHGKTPKPKDKIHCACGCGTLIQSYDCYGRPRQFVNHHARRGQPFPEDAKQRLRAQRQGKKLTPEHRARIAVGLRQSDKRIGRPPNSTKKRTNPA